MGSVLQWLKDLTTSRRWVYWTLAVQIGLVLCGCINGGNVWLVQAGESGGLLAGAMPLLSFALDVALNFLVPACVFMLVLDVLLSLVEWKSIESSSDWLHSLVFPSKDDEPGLSWFKNWVGDGLIFLVQIIIMIFCSYGLMHPDVWQTLVPESVGGFILGLPMMFLVAFVIGDWVKTFFVEIPRHEYYLLQAKLRKKS